MEMISRYRVAGDHVRVFAGYSPRLCDEFRAIGGKWEATLKFWSIPKTRLPEIVAELGSAASDPVLVDVPVSALDENEKYCRIGWYVLASRRGRDTMVSLYADAVAGRIPACGGSVKNPAVAPAADTVFRLVVPRDFAEARGLSIVRPLRGCRSAELGVLLERRAALLRELSAVRSALLDGTTPYMVDGVLLRMPEDVASRWGSKEFSAADAGEVLVLETGSAQFATIAATGGAVVPEPDAWVMGRVVRLPDYVTEPEDQAFPASVLKPVGG